MEASLIYPHQLFNPASHPALAPGRPVYLVEEPLILTHNPIHRHKLIFHKLTLDAYADELRAAGYNVTRLTIHAYPTTDAVFARLHTDSITTIHVTDTTDGYLERALTQSGLDRIWSESPLFLLPKAEAMDSYTASGKHLARFYKRLRQERGILLTPDGSPLGGQWSYDADNRQRLPRHTTPPADITNQTNPTSAAAAAWAATVPAEQYGDAGCWLPYTRTAAEAFLEEFLHTRFAHFGPYEDAITITHTRLWHSTLAPLLNCGLLTPEQVLNKAIAYAALQDIPLNSLEGFVRQILGWREFIRASYEVDGRKMRTSNFFQHSRPLPPGSWTAETSVFPLDHTIQTALRYGYTHHIERLMVAGNFFLLTGTHPTQVYRWFMGMYVDAYDWVMVPNVYGMSQFADGGSFATKPYISGSNYLKKMSDYPRGDWEELWTALYWNFIAEHEAVFTNNHRLAMMPRMLARQADNVRTGHRTRAQTYLAY